MTVYNFSAGPAMLPAKVMERAQAEFCNYKDCGNGIVELSHRGALFTEVIERAEQNFRDIMGISDDYAVCFIQGGASMQFAMLAMNLLEKGKSADYADTGVWSAKAFKEAKLFGDAKLVCSSKETKYDHIPAFDTWTRNPNATYLHITSNNTVAGTQYAKFPEVLPGVPMIADMSSDIMSRKINVNDFGLIYAGAQKNMAPAGLTVVIIDRTLAGRERAVTPLMMSYQRMIDKDSMYNTPPCYNIYMLGLVLDWLEKQGGVAGMEKRKSAKAKLLYDYLDESALFRGCAERTSRSDMNVTFRTGDAGTDAEFVKFSLGRGLRNLKGHRVAGGMRASLYNAMPEEGVLRLVETMKEFEAKHHV